MAIIFCPKAPYIKLMGIFRYMIIGWKVVINGKRKFTHDTVLACFDYCVANGLSTKIVKCIMSKKK